VCLGIGVGVWSASYIVEALRPIPPTPTTLRWAPQIPIGSVAVGDCRLRYIVAGQGPTLVLLHTLRTQLDLFEQVVPELARSFTVYALDLSCHGFSNIPPARYDAAFFAGAVAGFLDALDLRAVTLAGVSIGGRLPPSKSWLVWAFALLLCGDPVSTARELVFHRVRRFELEGQHAMGGENPKHKRAAITWCGAIGW